MTLVVATRNQGKLSEIRSLLDAQDIEVVSLDDTPGAPEVVEDGQTFAENAKKKAVEIARFSGCLTLADDSGLVVPDLGGEPGVRSARYAGPDATDEQNNLKLLAEIQHRSLHQPSAYFCCIIALADPSGDTKTFEGRLDGRLICDLRGDKGFGYDPMFLVPEYGRTLAELPMEVKNRISHRGQALALALATLTQDNSF